MDETYAQVSPITHGVDDLPCPPRFFTAAPTAETPTSAPAKPRARRGARAPDVSVVLTFAESLARSYAERLALAEPGELHRV